MSEIEQAHEWNDSLNICSTLGMEVSDEVRRALTALLENMSKKENRPHLALSLGGSRFNRNLEQIVQLANRLNLLEKICCDDANFIPAIVAGTFQNPQLKEISVCIASPSWKDSALKSLCQALTSSSSNIGCLRIRTWTYIDNYSRNHGDMPDTASWDEGLDPILEAIAGNASVQHLQLQVHSNFSPRQMKLLRRILCHGQCHIIKLDLRIQRIASTSKCLASHSPESILPRIISNPCLKEFHLCGWKMNSKDAECLRGALRSCRNLVGFKFDRSMVECDRNEFVTKLLQLDFLKSISSYSNSWSSSPPKRYDDLDLDKILPAIIQNETLEALKMKNMNVSVTSVNKLLESLGEHCPNLKTLKIINVSAAKGSVRNQKVFLEPIHCRNLEVLHLIGLPPFECKRNPDAFFAKRRDWFVHALENNPRLYSFGPGECCGLTRFLRDVDAGLLQLADQNRFGRGLLGNPKYHNVWPKVLEQINTSLDDPQRQASVIYGLLSNGCLSSFP